MELNRMTEQIIGAAIDVRRTLGPGLLESVYEECLCHELNLRNIPFERQRPLPAAYKGVRLDCGYRAVRKKTGETLCYNESGRPSPHAMRHSSSENLDLSEGDV